MDASTSAIAANLARVREQIASACARAVRRPEEVTLIAVSKTFPAEAIRAAYATGARHFGENRVQEREGKREALEDLDAAWHLVGHLQSNKARRAVALFHTIDSVDSLALAQRLDRAVAESASLPTRDLLSGPSESAVGAQYAAPLPREPRRLPILLEIRLAPEESKSGLDPAALPPVAEAILALEHLDLRGLMCIPPFSENSGDARPYFRKLRQLRDHLEAALSGMFPELSMGMSHDFEVAIEEGATQVRLGTAVFGERT